jgi:hypothetical protein
MAENQLLRLNNRLTSGLLQENFNRMLIFNPAALNLRQI